ncbi:hypothetical protein [Thalassotalea agarivorans]|uniref:Uncharacterized protein n=1 Tax=Thalassotalea agarivorans TaxID=349064 RepID=A0A1I0BQR4_THASX|nr:hypothetical protein [Thalassotalea agarivorans]SET09348.1 hypothetical protein SAMN05660429_01028 [Thalassotalea agarivorans]
MKLTIQNIDHMKTSIETAYQPKTTDRFYNREIFENLVLKVAENIEKTWERNDTESQAQLETSMRLQMLEIKLKMYQQGKFHLLIDSDAVREAQSKAALAHKDKLFITQLIKTTHQIREQLDDTRH